MVCRCTQKAMEMEKLNKASCCSSKKNETTTKPAKVSCCSGKNEIGKPSKCCCGTGCGCPSCNTTKL